jgi:Fic family protein
MNDFEWCKVPEAGQERWDWDFREEYQSRRQRLASRGSFFATVPAKISDAPIAISSELAAELEYVTGQLVRFDSSMNLSAPLATILLRTESASSSEVEQLTASAKQLAMAEVTGKTTPNSALIMDNVRAMQAATALSADFTAQAVMQMHEALMARSNPSIAGRIRTRPVWIGGHSPHTAKFVGPKPEHIQPLLDDLVAFSERFDIQRLAQIAIIHAQFETIHPFEDGNGRTGRALIQTLMRRYGIATQTTIPVSAGLLSNTHDYFSALDAFRNGSAKEIVEVFLSASTRAVDLGAKLVEKLENVGLWHFDATPGKSNSLQRRLIPLLPGNPAVDSQLVQKLLGVSATSALTGLRILEEVGVLTKINGKRRNQIWISTEILEALEEFAREARRA